MSKRIFEMGPSGNITADTRVQRSIYFLIWAACAWHPTMAQAVDCTAIKATDTPYQLNFEKDGRKTYPVQIYRGPDLARRQASMVNNRLFVVIFQANFQLDNPGLHDEKITTTYSVPTNNYIWQQGTRVVHGNTLIDGKPSAGLGFEAIYAMLPDEVVVLGSCSFPSKHYTVRQESPAITMMSDVWFSPDLNTVLKTTISTTVTSTGKTTETALEAKSIDTDFNPVR